MMCSRKEFLLSAASLVTGGFLDTRIVMTVNGPVNVADLGRTLVHEHFLVDFVGADKISYDRWEKTAVVKKVMPYLVALKKFDVKTIFDCTPAFLGRDVKLLKMIAAESGLQVVTNTGYYGAVDNKYLPAHAFTDNAEQLARRWIREFEKGIEDSPIRPGFIKIGVNPGPLSEMHKKLVHAAAITHKVTGLAICSHTGKAPAAFEQMELLQALGVEAKAFVWVHAQDETDESFYPRAIKQGAWLSLDGIGWGKPDKYIEALVRLKKEGLLKKVLISHDAGWYKPGEVNGGSFNSYTPLFEQVLPDLVSRGFTKSDVAQLLVNNPAEAFAIDAI